jgi:bis(5'-nucleosyl)-tetraphosphatase (symmetrical)
MALYAIGDVQGCYDSLGRLLDKIRFDPAGDRLWFTGDLVNRGPRSADVVRLVADLGDRATTVIGNHDLHLLAVASRVRAEREGERLKDILEASDRERLLTWISRRPLFHHDAAAGYALVHAGLLPQWDIADAIQLAQEAETVIAGPQAREFFTHMYGNKPNRWSEDLKGWDRLRVIVNGFTRTRFCDARGSMDFDNKGPPMADMYPLLPWFQIPSRRSRGTPIVFGHWSLLGRWNRDGAIGLDTGCVWGRQLTAVRLDVETPEFFDVQSDFCARRGV